MKFKAAKRFLARNQSKFVRHSLDYAHPKKSFLRRYKKATEAYMRGVR